MTHELLNLENLEEDNCGIKLFGKQCTIPVFVLKTEKGLLRQTLSFCLLGHIPKLLKRRFHLRGHAPMELIFAHGDTPAAAHF